MQLKISKTDKKIQVVWGELYAPTPIPDAHNDVMTAEEIRAMAYRFMQNGDMHCVDTNHDQVRNGAFVVESFIVMAGNPDFMEGAWVVGVHVPDVDIWAKIESGELSGFSLDFSYYWEEVEYEIEIPEFVEGQTSENEGHHHRFKVFFDAEGNFIGGETYPAADGHTHKIVHGTKTLMANGHDHVFSFIELLNNGEVVLVSEDTEEEDS